MIMLRVEALTCRVGRGRKPLGLSQGLSGEAGL